MKKIIKLIFIFLIIPLNLFCNNNNLIYNPFNNNFGSILDYNRFKTFQQFSFFSFSGREHSSSYGVFLNTIEYGINNNLTAQIHLGKKMNFNNKESFQFEDKNNYLAGGTLIYKTKSSLTIGLEYGSTPNDLNIFNHSLFFNSYSSFSYLENNGNNNLKLWLNKEFNHNTLSLIIYYHKQQLQNNYWEEYQ